MPISTSEITGYSHNVIVPSISMIASTGDIERILNETSGDLQTLCQSRKINKWAKYKPIDKAIIDTTGQLDSNLKWKSTSDWWQGSSGNCGFEMVSTPPAWSASTSDLTKDAATLESEAKSLDAWFHNSWNYLFWPKGGTSSPFRQIDFNYYDHNAVPFVKGLSYPNSSTFYAGSDSGNMTWQMLVPSNTEATYSLGFADIKGSGSNLSLSYYHFGLIFVNVGSKFPQYSNFKYRKFVIVNSATIGSNGGMIIRLTGADTSALANPDNIASEQEYKVYPIMVTSGSTSMSVFGTASLGDSMVVIPNSDIFNLSLVPNELEGFLQGGELEEVYSPVSSVNYTNNGTYISIINRSTKTVTVSSINLYMEIWQKSGTTYQQVNTISSGYTLDTSLSFSISAGGSKIIHVNWTIDKSNFTVYRDYMLREGGNIKYTKTGSSALNTAMLLSNPAYAPNSLTPPMLFQGHISVDTITSTYFYVNIWVENISGIKQDFSWSSIVYDITSYPKTESGTNYNNGLVQTGITISGTTETNIPVGGTSTVKSFRIEPRRDSYGYFASVTVRGNTGYNVGNATGTANY